MRLTPRAEEVAEVVSILESDKFETPEDMAKAIIKQVADFLQFREFYLLRATKHWFGIWSSEAEAQSYANQVDGSTPVKVWPIGKPEQRPGGGFGYCTTEDCGHPEWAHSFSAHGRGFCVPCGQDVCGKYQASKPKAKARPRKVTA